MIKFDISFNEIVPNTEPGLSSTAKHRAGQYLSIATTHTCYQKEEGEGDYCLLDLVPVIIP